MARGGCVCSFHIRFFRHNERLRLDGFLCGLSTSALELHIFSGYNYQLARFGRSRLDFCVCKALYDGSLRYLQVSESQPRRGWCNRLAICPPNTTKEYYPVPVNVPATTDALEYTLTSHTIGLGLLADLQGFPGFTLELRAAYTPVYISDSEDHKLRTSCALRQGWATDSMGISRQLMSSLRSKDSRRMLRWKMS